MKGGNLEVQSQVKPVLYVVVPFRHFLAPRCVRVLSSDRAGVRIRFLGEVGRTISCLEHWVGILRCWRATPWFVVSQRNLRRRGHGEYTKPSSNPSPVVAQLGTTNQILSFSCESFRASVTSWGFMATNLVRMSLSFKVQKRCIPPGISCLLAKTSSNDSFISRSLMMRCNSCLASSMRALSEESITKIRPCVPANDISACDLQCCRPLIRRLHTHTPFADNNQNRK